MNGSLKSQSETNEVGKIAILLHSSHMVLLAFFKSELSLSAIQCALLKY